jgi:hypothetical protein
MSGIVIPGRPSPVMSSQGVRLGHSRQASITDVDAHERRLRRQVGNRFHYESGFQPATEVSTDKESDDVDVEDLTLDAPRSAGCAGKGQIPKGPNLGLNQVAVQLAASRDSDINVSVPELPNSNYLDSVDFVNACKNNNLATA